MLSFVRTCYATFVRDWTINWRVYSWDFLLGGIISALCGVGMAYFFFYFLAAGQIGDSFIAFTGSGDYMSYMIWGTIILIFTVRFLLGVSHSMITERREGTLASLSIAPASRLAYFVGVTLQYGGLGLAEATVMLLIVWPLGLHLRAINFMTLLLVLPTSLLCLIGVALVLGACMLATKDTFILQNTLVAFIGLLCGFVFPPNYLPLPLQWLSMLLPPTGVLRLLRALLLDGATPSAIVPDLLLYIPLGFVYLVIGLLCMRQAERRALEGAY